MITPNSNFLYITWNFQTTQNVYIITIVISGVAQVVNLVSTGNGGHIDKW